MMSGNQKQDMTLTYPDDCIQSLIDDWWIPTEKSHIERGRLLLAFVPHVDQLPYLLVPKGRNVATEHSLADCEITPLDVNNLPTRARLPVAGLPCYDGEVRTVHRAKIRPILVLALPGPEIPKKYSLNKPKWQTAPSYIVAPYYGVDEGTGKRAGYSRLFAERVKHCMYHQFFWEKLPLSGSNESILRFDHIQPMGGHYKSYKLTSWKLSPKALNILDDWLQWHFHDNIPEESDLPSIIELLQEFEGEQS